MAGRLEIAVVPPAGCVGLEIARGAARAGAFAFVDPARVDVRATGSLSRLAGSRWGVVIDRESASLIRAFPRVPVAIAVSRRDRWTAESLGILVAAAREKADRVFVEVVSRGEAALALEASVDGLVVKGHEAGGRTGEETTLVLLQRLLDTGLPLWARGGIGLHSAAGCLAMGAAGIVLDDQLLLASESDLDPGLAVRLKSTDGGETVRTIDGDDGHGRRFVRTRLETASGAGHEADRDDAILWGQDIAFASPLAARFVSVRGIVRAFRASVRDHLVLAASRRPLDEASPLASFHGTRWPVVQGPMTRVSDVAPFAAAIAEGGGLPFFALALMRRDEVKPLLDEAAERLGDRPWGVGILGFVPADLRDEQLDAILDVRPRFALVAGGRPDQGARLEREGIATYLHAPSSGLLRMFLDQGARRFVFEGRECGGHVGPLASAVLWDRVTDTILEWLSTHPGETIDVLFAGGIHDARSAAAAATIAAPLAEAGCRFGVLMGTAYLFTREAVESGAIVPGFQKAVVECRETMLLDAEGGHATRCARSGYGDEFHEEKRKLSASGIGGDELRELLETLNVGRLRIATKGLKRIHHDDGSSEIVEVDSEVQRVEGMYMAGQVAALHRTVATIEELHRDVCAGGTSRIASIAADAAGAIAMDVTVPRRDEPIAIVGMSGFFPGASSIDTFRANLYANRDVIREVPARRWDASLFYDPDRRQPDRIDSKWGGFLDPIVIDPTRFGIPPASVRSIEPTQLLVLEAVRRLFEESGYDRRPFARERAAVIIGHGGGASDLGAAYQTRTLVEHYLWRADGLDPGVRDVAIEAIRAVTPSLTEDSFPGILGNVSAGRVANRFDLSGPNYTVDAACASSLAALDAAVRELRFGTSEMAIVGGFDGQQHPFGFMLFSKTQALSPRGRCRPFDASADGIAISEAIAFVMLKRLSDAERDGDRVYAVIRGVGSASDGRDRSLTAPSPRGQKLALERAYASAGIEPADVSLVEAHGTGTVVGDRTEIATLLDVYANASPQSCALGSVKSQIGHTKNAAGLCGLIKSAFSLHHRAIAPTLVDVPADAIRDRSNPFYLATRTMPWFHRADRPRRAGVSAFGFGGTNFHAVVEEYPGDAAALPVRDAELFVFRAKTVDGLLAECGEILARLGAESSPRPIDVARALARDAVAGEVRLSIVAKSLDELRLRIPESVDAVRDGRAMPQGVHFSTGENLARPRVAFLFPGQGSQFPGMLERLAVAFPVVRETIEEAEATLEGILPTPFARAIAPPPAYAEEERREQSELLDQTWFAQPALGAAEIGLVRLLEQLGIRPTMVAGHSYGEYVALAAAGALSFDDLIALSEVRGRVVQESQGRGDVAMLAVSEAAAAIERILVDGVSIAGRNAPRQTIVGGRHDAIERFEEVLRGEKIPSRRLTLSAGFHIAEAQDAADRFAPSLAATAIGRLNIPAYANVTGQPHGSDAEAIRTNLLAQLVRPVDFQKQVETMIADGAGVFLEVGPGSVLTRLSRQIAGDPSVAMPLLDGRGPREVESFLDAIGDLWVRGVPVRLDGLFQDADVRGDSLERLVAAEEVRSSTAIRVDGGGVASLDGEGDAERRTVAVRAVKLESRATRTPMADISRPSGSADAPQFAADSADARTLDAIMLRFLEHQRESQRRRFELMERFLTVRGGGVPADARSHEPTTVRTDDEPTAPAPPAHFAPAVEKVSIPEAPAVRPSLKPGVHEIVLELVAERTGYPVDVLDLDFTMEGDLGIDSIKRTEIFGALRDRLGIDQGGIDQEEYFFAISRLRTLREVLAWLDTHLSLDRGAETPVDAIDATPVDRGVGIHEIVLGLVAERTGYPVDVLDLDFTMEGDLGIDSIKRTEIFGALRDRLGIGQDGIDQEEYFFAISRLRTLREVLAWLDTHVSVGRGVAPATGDEAANEPAGPSANDARIQRHVVEVSAAAAPAGQPRLADLDGTTLLTADTSGHADELARTIRGLGRSCIVVRHGTMARKLGPSDYEADLESHDSVDHLRTLLAGEIDTVAAIGHLLPLAPPADVPASRCLEVRSLFHLVATFGTQIVAANGAVVAIARMGPRWSTGAVDRVFQPGASGMAGFLKALAREWPDVFVRTLSVDAAADDELLVAQLLADSGVASGGVEVGFSAAGRVTRRIVRRQRSAGGDLPDLGPSPVIVSIGGARGITAHLTEALAAHYHPRLVLVGRSGMPREEDPEIAALSDPTALKRLMVSRRRRRGDDVAPAVIDAECESILRGREMRATLDRLRSCTRSLDLRSLDVRDGVGFHALIRDVRARYGRIDAVIHGAGVVEDRLLASKSSESFDRVFDTKVVPGLVLADALDPAETRLVVFLSSVASEFGYAGGSDYCAANDVLNDLARAMNRSWPGRAVAIGWGPWRETGIASRMPEEHFVVDQGLVPMGVREARDAFLQELRAGADEDAEVLLFAPAPGSIVEGILGSALSEEDDEWS